jgi:hypothetical protein
MLLKVGQSLKIALNSLDEYKKAIKHVLSKCENYEKY